MRLHTKLCDPLASLCAAVKQRVSIHSSSPAPVLTLPYDIMMRQVANRSRFLFDASSRLGSVAAPRTTVRKPKN